MRYYCFLIEGLADFTHELITAARHYQDTPAIYHQDFAGNCIENPSDYCFSDGIGPDSFDCSGFVLRSICDVTGSSVYRYGLGLRHVRDMWQAADTEGSPLYMSNPVVGSLLVTRRTYTIHGEEISIPGHIGIITSTESTLAVIHANPKAGKVEERPIRSSSHLGYLGLRTCSSQPS